MGREQDADRLPKVSSPNRTRGNNVDFASDSTFTKASRSSRNPSSSFTAAQGKVPRCFQRRRLRTDVAISWPSSYPVSLKLHFEFSNSPHWRQSHRARRQMTTLSHQTYALSFSPRNTSVWQSSSGSTLETVSQVAELSSASNCWTKVVCWKPGPRITLPIAE